MGSARLTHDGTVVMLGEQVLILTLKEYPNVFSKLAANQFSKNLNYSESGDSSQCPIKLVQVRGGTEGNYNSPGEVQ